MQAATHIHVKGAREHNLKNLELRIPRGKLVVITGPSGSGKSSLAFDTIYAEGYRKYMESLSTQARQVLEQLKRPDVDFIHGLSPVLAIEQRTGAGGPRSTIATATELADYAQLLWALCGEQRCPKDGGRVVQRSLDDNVQRILRECAGERVMLLAPAMRARASVLRDELPRLRQRGFQRVRLDGEIKNLDEPKLLGTGTGSKEIVVDLVIDRLVASADQRSRLADSLELAFREGNSAFGWTPASAFADSTSWGYQILGRLDYTNVFAGVNVSPTVGFTHDVSGNTPLPLGNYVSGRKSINLSAEFTFQNSWALEVRYVNFFDGGRYNLLADRDYVATTLKYSF